MHDGKHSPVSDLGTKIRRGTIWTFAGKFSTEILNFMVGIALARILLPEHFGLVTTVGIVTGLAGYFSGAGTGQALVRAKHVDQRHTNVVFTLQMGIGTGIYLLFVLIAPYFATFFGQPIYQSLLLVSGLNFFMRPFTNLPSALLQREMRFRPLTVVSVINIFITSTVSIALALLDYGAWSLIYGGLVGGMTNALMLNLHLRQKYSFGWNKKIAAELSGYGARVAINSLLEHFRGQSLLFVLSKLNGPADVGLYNRASSLAALPFRLIGSAPYQVILRALAVEQDNLDKSRYIYFHTVTLVTTYTLPLYVLTWWLAEPGILFIYGTKWLAAAAPLSILAISGLFSCLSNPSGAVVEARNRIAAEIKLNIFTWTLLMAGMFYGLQWGLSGLAWVVVITRILFTAGITSVAIHELQGSLRMLLEAIAPALILNALLLATLNILDLLFTGSYEHSHPGFYATSVAAIGGVCYATAFLLLPFKKLESEATRWRNRLTLR